jgi:hypothetical protein
VTRPAPRATRIRPDPGSGSPLPSRRSSADRAGMSRADRGAPCRLFAALRAQALAPRQAQIRRIWRVGRAITFARRPWSRWCS